jgi:NAD(P)-dependent dehydrogenase (short-subunit alcohol dehydrogenase family)
MGLRKKLLKFFYIRKYKNKSSLVQVKKKNILITGANSGIGLALLKKLLTFENKVLATYNSNSQNLDEIKSNNFYKIKCDQRVNSDFTELKKRLNNFKIDIIFNCAGVVGPSFQDQEIEEINFEDFNEVLSVNALSIVKIIQLILKNKNSVPQLIINISSDAGSLGKNTQGNAYIYRTSKSALNSITKNMSVDLYKKYKTISIAIDPGNVKTNMNPGGYLQSDDCASSIINIISSDLDIKNGKFLDLNGNEIPW